MKKLLIGTLLAATTNVFAMGSGSVTLIPSECGTTPEYYNYNRSSPPISGILTDYSEKGREEYSDIFEKVEIVNSCPFYAPIRDMVNEYMEEAQVHRQTASYHDNNDMRKFGANCLAVIDSKIYSMGRDLYESVYGELGSHRLENEEETAVDYGTLNEIFSFGSVCEGPATEEEEPTITIGGPELIDPSIDVTVTIPGSNSSDDEEDQESPSSEEQEEEVVVEVIKDKIVTCPMKAKFRATVQVSGLELVTNAADFSKVRAVQVPTGFVYTCMYTRAGIQGVGLYRIKSSSECDVEGNVIKCEQ